MFCRVKATKKPAILTAIVLALMATSMCAAMVNAATVTTCVITVEKSNAPVESASVQLYAATREWYGIYYDRGDLVAVNMTDALGQCSFDNLDDSKYYQAIVTVEGKTYQANFEGDTTVDINLGATEAARGNLYIAAVGAVIAIIGLIAFGWIKMTNRAPVQIGAQ